MKETLFEKKFKKKLKSVKDEDENSVGGGALGPEAAIGHTQGDFYAKGDYRIPQLLGSVYSRLGKVKSTKRKNTKKRKKTKKQTKSKKKSKK